MSLWLKDWIRPIIACGTLIHITYNFFFPQFAFAMSAGKEFMEFPLDKDIMNTYLAKKEKLEQLERIKRVSQNYRIITAYSSTVGETDSNPFITASGAHVREGIVAANTLPFGSKIMIPDLFGDRIFTVEDRLAPKNWHKIDIWFPSTKDAIKFGVKRANIVVIPQDVATVLEKPSA